MRTEIGRGEWLTTTEMTMRYHVGAAMLQTWRKWRSFPEEACERRGNVCLWHVELVDEWLRARTLHRVGRPPRWAELVGHPGIA